MHPHQDITAPHKLATDIQLRNRRPIAILLDPAPQILILEHIERGELFRVDALQPEDLDRGPRETALGCFGGAFHEQHDGCGGDGFVDGGADFGGEEARLQQGVVYKRGEGGGCGGGTEGREGAAECLCWVSPKEGVLGRGLRTGDSNDLDSIVGTAVCRMGR